MPSNLTPAKLLLAAAVTASTLAGFGLVTARAADPKPTTPVAKTETEGEHIQALREIRRTLNETRKMLKEEPMADGDANRPAALKALETAIDAVNHEVIDYEHAHPSVAPKK